MEGGVGVGAADATEGFGEDAYRVGVDCAGVTGNERREPMSSKKKRQTMDKLRREQTVRKRREDKLQRKADARAAKSAAPLDEASSGEADGTGAADPQGSPLPATVETTKNGSGLRDAPSLRVHQQ